MMVKALRSPSPYKCVVLQSILSSLYPCIVTNHTSFNFLSQFLVLSTSTHLLGLFSWYLSIVTMNPNGSVPAEFLANHVLSSTSSFQFLASLSSLNDDLLNLALSEEMESSTRLGGSVPGRGANLPCDAEAGHALLFQDYFAENPVYPEKMFLRRFRMSRGLFLHIMEKLAENDVYFTQRYDALGQL